MISLSTYHLIDSLMSMAVVGLAILAVVRENPFISIGSAMFLMLAVISSAGQDILPETYLLTPIPVVSVMATLLVVYASMIWSSEFETPPEIIEKYRWYLDQLSYQSDPSQLGRSTSRAGKDRVFSKSLEIPSTSTDRAFFLNSFEF
ncbi:hypothetical protein HDE_01841 [Halotydeus destructor]|nr:hypothetical protein HDE_01841 [Halotydeus destructor]